MISATLLQVRKLAKEKGRKEAKEVISGREVQKEASCQVLPQRGKGPAARGGRREAAEDRACEG